MPQVGEAQAYDLYKSEFVMIIGNNIRNDLEKPMVTRTGFVCDNDGSPQYLLDKVQVKFGMCRQRTQRVPAFQ